MSYIFYRPMQVFSYMLDFSWWGLNPDGYHLTNIVWHLLAASLVYFAAFEILKDKTASFLTALLFALHPVHTEAVAYISGRADSLALVFLLAAFLGYLKSLESRRIGIQIASIAFFLMAILSKESALIFPVLIFLHHRVFKTKFPGLLFWLSVGITLAYGALRLTLLRSFMIFESGHGNIFERIPGFFASYLNYLKLLVWPSPLHMEYGFTIYKWSDPFVWGGAVAMTILLLVMVQLWRRGERAIFFGCAWFLVALIPVSNLFLLNASMAEHWLYVPSIGVFLALSEWTAPLFKKSKLKELAVISVAAILAGYGLATFEQSKTWKDPVIFYERTLDYAPNSLAVNVNLGLALYERGEISKAYLVFKKAVELGPNQYFPYFGLGLCANSLGKHPEAIAAYNRCLELKPDLVQAHNNLSEIYYPKTLKGGRGE